MARNAVAAKRRSEKIKPDQLAPKIAEGYTTGMTAEEALRQFPTKRPPSRIEHLRQDTNAPVFVAEDNEAIAVDPATGRRFRDATITRPPLHVAQIREGYRCLDCGEEFETAWPEECPVCHLAVNHIQSLRFAAEFEGEKHIGPSKPIKQYLDDLEERELKRQFEQEIGEGKSRMRGLH